ncbi:LON peptidase substrate-binding domain-containing protein [Nakamurella endophytica]|uniref:Lon N-terminal domain-containing protein n=1 Tax=Nakamurella endophytica TaxID=1748367 RepID=A0A917SQS0_9ACTN|nr:LON peptidase substrate-binding domain-containing protein [Nakamurella endophytica]GGL92744.1 hypothetical protein GCM10011594_10680 [Nakamurella endophytica]
MDLLRLPLFPLGTVLFPGEPLPLHVFEPRYLALITALLELPEDRRVFGVVAIRQGREVGADGVSALHDVGCSALLRDVSPRAAGRYDVLAVGVQRFHLVDTEFGDVRTGVVRMLSDDDRAAPAAGRDPGEDPAPGRSVGELAELVRQAFARYRDALLHARGVPGDAAGLRLPPDPLVLSYAVAAAMVLDLPDKQQLLASPDTAGRLRAELVVLRRETAMIRGLAMRPAVEFTRLPYTAN